MTTTDTTTTDVSFATEVNRVIARKATAINALSAGASDSFPHTGLLGHIDSARDAYCGALAAQTALRQVLVTDRGVALTLFEGATTADDLTLAVQVLTAARAAVGCFAGQSAVDAVDDVRRIALRRLEALHVAERDAR